VVTLDGGFLDSPVLAFDLAVGPGMLDLDVNKFAQDLRDRLVTFHITFDGHLSNTGKPHKTAIDGQTLCHAGYAVSQRCRKLIEEVFSWIKSSANLRKVKL
jgi:hypothetical protein